MTVSCFIEAGTLCPLCGVAMLNQGDNPVVVDLPGYGERAFHEVCLGPEVMAEITANQEAMSRGKG